MDDWVRTTSSADFNDIIHQQKLLILHDSDWSFTFSCKNNGSWICSGSESTEVSWTHVLGGCLLGQTDRYYAGGPVEIVKDKHQFAQHRQYMTETTDVETFTNGSTSVSRSRTTAFTVYYNWRVKPEGEQDSAWYGAPW